MTIKLNFTGAALSALAAMLAFTGMPSSAAAQEEGARERPRMEREGPRELRSFEPQESAPMRRERAERPNRAARAMTAPEQVQQVEARPQRPQRVFERSQPPAVAASEDRQGNYRRNGDGNRGFGLDPQRTRDARAERLRTQQDWRGFRQDRQADRQDYRQDRQADRQDYRQDRREDRQDYRQDRRNGGFALDPNRYRDGERNRTYRDGYRDGRRADWRNDRRDDRQHYRNGYRDGRHQGYNDHRRWDRRWRDNRRYDWYGYRSYNRDHYRLGRYYSPYRNYSYRRLSIGFTLDNLFFGSRYWINDPWQYRLPDVYGPYRWVRYYDDVLLVNTYSGEVVDVIYDFFW